jgi:CheY-like chemotaxis protein
VPVIMLSSKDGLFDKARGRMVGSEDYLTKPFTKDQLLRAVATRSAVRGLGERLPPARRTKDMAIQKILVVDDSKTELHHLSECCSSAASVRTAENGDEALRRLAEEKPDLILMDVVMPGQNGFQLTRTITRDPRLRRRAGDHVHQQEPGNRQGLGHAPGRARLRRQAGQRRRAGSPRSGPSTEAGQRRWPTRKPCANCRAGWQSACRRPAS